MAVEPSLTHLWIMLLAGMAYLLVTCTLTTLANRIRQQRNRHDLIVASRHRRREYLDTITTRQPPRHIRSH